MLLACIIKKHIAGILELPPLIIEDDLWSIQCHQLLEAVIAVDHVRVKAIEICRNHACILQLEKRAQTCWQDR